MDPVVIFLILHVFLISLTLAPALSFCHLEGTLLHNRWFYLNTSAWGGLFLTVMLATSKIADEVSCWSYLSAVFVSPPLVIFPYFFITFETWAIHKKKRARGCFLSWFARWNSGQWKATSSIRILVVLSVIQLVVAAICLGLRIKSGGMVVIMQECVLGTEMIFLVVDFALYILLAFFCIYLQVDSLPVPWKALQEQNLMMVWSLLTLGTFFIIGFHEGLYIGFQQKVFSPDLLVLLFNLGPVLFSLIPSAITYVFSTDVDGNKIRRIALPKNRLVSFFGNFLSRASYVSVSQGDSSDVDGTFILGSEDEEQLANSDADEPEAIAMKEPKPPSRKDGLDDAL